MTLDLAGRLVVLLACAVAVGVLYVRLAGARPAPVAPAARDGGGPAGASRATPRPLPGAVDAALGAFVVVAGGAAITGIGLGAGEGAGLALVRLLGIALLAGAGAFAVLPLPGGRRRPGAPALVGLAWLGAGLALLAPLVLMVAAVVIVVLAVRVADHPGP